MSSDFLDACRSSASTVAVESLEGGVSGGFHARRPKCAGLERAKGGDEMKILAASIIAIAFATPAAAAQQKSMCEMSPESCPACGHEGQPRCPTFAEEERAGKVQGWHQAGVGSAYVHFMHKPDRAT